MNANIRLTIVTVCFNSEKTIERTIKSILCQSNNNYEYIIVDGGSSDSTMSIVKRYEPLFKGRLKYISEPDEGIYDAFNKGCRMAVSSYIWIVNSDDYIEEGSVKFICELINNYGDDYVVVGGLNVINPDGSLKRNIQPNHDYICKMYEQDGMIPHPSTIVSKAVYEQFGYYNSAFKISGDKEWFHRVYKKGVKFIVAEKIISNLTIGGVSTVPNFRKEYKDQVLFLKIKYRETPSLFCSKYITWLLLKSISMFKNYICETLHINGSGK